MTTTIKLSEEQFQKLMSRLKNLTCAVNDLCEAVNILTGTINDAEVIVNVPQEETVVVPQQDRNQMNVGLTQEELQALIGGNTIYKEENV